MFKRAVLITVFTGLSAYAMQNDVVSNPQTHTISGISATAHVPSTADTQVNHSGATLL